jgi:hypothetical protein
MRMAGGALCLVFTGVGLIDKPLIYLMRNCRNVNLPLRLLWVP